MIKRPFIGLSKPKINYEVLKPATAEPKHIPQPGKVTLFIETPYNHKDTPSFSVGDRVKTGQKLSYAAGNDAYAISTVTGTIASIAPFFGDYGKSYTAVTIETAKNEEQDDTFAKLAKNPTLDIAKDYLAGLPGAPPFTSFMEPKHAIDTIIVCGVDTDLLMTTNQYVLKNELEALSDGIRILQGITRVDRVIVAVPYNLMQDAAALGVEVRTVGTAYPAALPLLMVKSFTGQAVPAGKKCEDVGISCFTAEAVAAIGKAFKSGSIPVVKTLTLIDKEEKATLVSAKVGSPVGAILDAFAISLDESDRIVFGGPMTGSAIFSTDQPILPNTDAVIIQAKDKLDHISNYPCINCGDCIRACPANIPINMLVRLLEAGQYEEASEQYDLDSCIECALCSYVCVSKIPVFHYIKLAKYELNKMRTAEATDAQS
jgi:electron transport complex protein RnfC